MVALLNEGRGYVVTALGYPLGYPFLAKRCRLESDVAQLDAVAVRLQTLEQVVVARVGGVGLDDKRPFLAYPFFLLLANGGFYFVQIAMLLVKRITIQARNVGSLVQVERRFARAVGTSQYVDSGLAHGSALATTSSLPVVGHSRTKRPALSKYAT